MQDGVTAVPGAGMSSSAIIRTQDLSLQFEGGTIHALNGVDFAMAEGEFVALVGPSGCGKSSLLGIIGLLERPDGGEVWFRDQPYGAIRAEAAFRRRHFGFIFQSFNLIPTLSALQNVLVPVIGAGRSAAAAEPLAVELLGQLGLGSRLAHLPGQMSGGERQRVAIARALVNDPEVILADEPTGSLDSTHAQQVLDLLAGLRRQRGLTILMVTHDQEVSARADRIVRMRDGRVAA